ncbi:S-adenosyl-L-methionine-dependent methyltransferase [Phytophthora cactorum]|nr:S-adenosyl-L-methionine-dependent methyltransferase [Phytophthora cactorum]
MPWPLEPESTKAEDQLVCAITSSTKSLCCISNDSCVFVTGAGLVRALSGDLPGILLLHEPVRGQPRAAQLMDALRSILPAVDYPLTLTSGLLCIHSLARSFMNVLRNSAAISVACVALIVHCDATYDCAASPDEPTTYNSHACAQIFSFVQSEDVETLVPGSYGGAILIWCMGMFLAITNFFLERFSGIRMIASFGWFSNQVEDDEVDELSEGENGHELLPPEQNLPMVPCYQIARLLAQPQLEVDCQVPDDKSYGEDALDQEEAKTTKTKTIKRVFPRGDALVIGGDLAYPHPDDKTYETRLFRCFEYAMKPPPSYHPSSISTQKKAPDGCASLREYEGPSVFAIPGNHDWFDGLNTFTRYICQRDWLGGWLLPQKTSYFSLKLPHGWWLFGVDLALENDVDTEQFGFFERVVKTQMGPNDAVIVLTHEPRWLLDVYETSQTLTSSSPSSSMQFDTPRPKMSTTNLPRRHSFSSPVHKHFPHMKPHDDLSNEERTPRDAELQADPPADHERSAEHLIISGGGGAFLHPTHIPSSKLASNGGTYEQKLCYPPAHISSIILGIDLLPIRPIRGVKTFQCDITTVRCRQIIKQEMQSWQADVVLCDGAPNVGTEYSKDAYVQNELALIALKLAVDVMGRGGTFVSKVFRSQDYNALLWVFKQLFKKVSATKPLSSRNESAEIFVVCEQFLAPQSIDPKLFDPKYVFDQVDSQEKTITIFHPKFGDRKRHREGYDEALGMTLTNECSVSQFIDDHDPIRLLTDTTSIKFLPEDDVYRDHKDTSDEIVTCLKDLKVLGKGDFKSLLKWRTRMQKYKEELLKAETPEDEKEEEKPAQKEPERDLTEKEKDALVREELSQLRANRKQKLRIRAALGMNAEGIDVTEAESAFSLKELKMSKNKVDELENVGADSSSDDELQFETSDEEDENADLEDSDAEYDDSDDSDDDEDDLNVSLKVPEKSSAAVNRWFSDNKLFDGIDEKEALALLTCPRRTKRFVTQAQSGIGAQRTPRQEETQEGGKEYELEFGTEFDIAAPANSDDEAAMAAEAQEDSDDEATTEKKALIRSGMGAALKADQSSTDKFEVVAASQDLIDASYNRYAWNDSEALPDWFADDEEKHYRPQIPIPKNVLAQMKERFMEMATKPVKKVAEARGRKQRMQMKKLKAAKKKATDIANLPDMSTREKLKAIDRAMKGARLKKESKVYVVSTRGGTRTADGKKIGKGKVKVVDPRMKSDKRNAEIRAKRGKKRKR